MKKTCVAAMAALSLILVGCSGDRPRRAPAGSSARRPRLPSAEPSAESTSAPARTVSTVAT